MTDKNAITNLYEYCQRKNSKVALADLNFEYPIENQLFNCKIIIKNKYINKTYYDASFFSKSKKEAKNKIADIVYKDLLGNSDLNNTNEEDDNKNFIVKLNEYLQDKNTNINLSDVIFEYEINKNDGTYNCKVNIPKLNKIYDNKLTCKSKKAAKNEISEIVFKILTNQKGNNFFNDKIISLLSLNNINIEDLNLETHEDEEDKDKFMCLIEFKNIPQKYFLCLEPMTKEELNKKFYEFLENNDEFINKEEKKEKDESNYDLKDYISLYKIPCKFIFSGKKHIKCRCEALGVLLGEGKEKIGSKPDTVLLRKNAENYASREALKTIKDLINSSIDDEKAFYLYKNEINLRVDKEIYNAAITDDDSRYNIYIQNITQNFTSTNSKKEEKKYLNEINNLITETMNYIKKKSRFNGSYLIKKINNYEVWNLINYEIVLFIEFKIEYIDHCFETILSKLKEYYNNFIMELDYDDEVKHIRLRLKNGCTFSIYIGSNIYDKLLTKYIIPFKGCLDIERKYIQFVILWSNLVLYQDFNSEKDHVSYLSEQERIFTTLALFSWDYTSKNSQISDGKRKKNIYILSFITLVNVILNYLSVEICWYPIKGKGPYLIDPISNRNLITSENSFIWKAYKKYCETIYNKNDKKVKLIPDEKEYESNKDFMDENNLKIYFQPYVYKPNSFDFIDKVYYVIHKNEEPESSVITVKTALFHIPKKSTNREKLTIIFNSLQSYLLLNIYNSENSIEIQNLNNEKNEQKFKELNKKLRKEIKYRIKSFFISLTKNDESEKRSDIVDKLNKLDKYESNELNKLYFILGNNTNVSIDIVVKFKKL